MMMPSCRLPGRFFCIAVVAAGVVSGSIVVSAQSGGTPKTTQVQDTVYHADGTPATGWMVITWPAFVTADKAAVAAGSKSIQLGSDGSFKVALAANTGGTPSGTYYTVTLKLDGGATSKEAWLVPATSPANLAAVRSGVVPATMAQQALSTDWANANLVSLSGAQSITGAKSFAVPPSAPDPVSATDVATKRYVDANSGGGQNVAKTNATNTWTQPQTFPFVVLGKNTTISEDSAVPGTVTLGTVASGNTNGTASIGNAANPIAAVYASGISSFRGNSSVVAADFTTSNNTNFQPITGLIFNLPATAYSWKYHCALGYSQANGNAAVAFGIQAATTNPTNIFAIGEQQVTAGMPATNTRGVLAGLNTTVATAIVSGTPGATATNYSVVLEGTIENPAAVNTINFVVSTGAGADAVTVRRGSECQIW